mgnify:CR=1 FL=1
MKRQGKSPFNPLLRETPYMGLVYELYIMSNSKSKHKEAAHELCNELGDGDEITGEIKNNDKIRKYNVKIC